MSQTIKNIYRNTPVLITAAMLAITVISANSYADKILVYDEEKGIVLVDKDSLILIKEKKKTEPVVEEKVVVKPREPAMASAKGVGDIHAHRKKDPPGLYFKSALDYYKDGDYENALKNFKYVAELDLKPEYLLWIGKTYRQLDKTDQMFSTMERVLADYDESDVADDALFEIAFYYQRIGDYEQATGKYKQLIEQYPFGLSYSNREEFLEVARTQLRTMRGEMVSTLRLLGIEEEELSDAYTQFQKTNNLKVTGLGDAATIRAIKEAYKNKVAEEELKAASARKFRQGVKWTLIAGVIFVLNLAFAAFTRMKIIQNRKHVFVLHDMLSEIHK